MTQFGYGSLPDDVVEQAFKLYREAQRHFQRGEFHRSEELVSQSLQLSPNAIPALLLHAQIMMRHERYDEAISSLSKLTELRPNDANAYMELGLALERTHQIRRALDAYRRAVELVTSSNQTVEWFDEVKRRCQQLETELSLERERHAHEERQREIEELLHLADVYDSSGFPRRAKDHLQRVLKLDPQNVDVALRIVAIDIELGNISDADEMLREIEEHHPERIEDVKRLRERFHKGV